MSLAVDLMGVGLPQEQAVRIGLSNPTSVTTAGTVVGTATVLHASVTNVELVTAASQTGLKLPDDAELYLPYFLRNSTATAANIFPPTGGFINGGSVNVAVTLATNLGRIFFRVSETRWVSFLTA